MARRKKKSSKKDFNLQHWLIAKLRRISYQFPARKEAIKKARVSRGRYRCAICGGENFGRGDIQLDHIEPVINPHTGFRDWNEFIAKLFCDEDKWQLLCRPCHNTKTSQENLVRKMVKNERDGNKGDL